MPQELSLSERVHFDLMHRLLSWMGRHYMMLNPFIGPGTEGTLEKEKWGTRKSLKVIKGLWTGISETSGIIVNRENRWDRDIDYYMQAAMELGWDLMFFRKHGFYQHFDRLLADFEGESVKLIFKKIGEQDEAHYAELDMGRQTVQLILEPILKQEKISLGDAWRNILNLTTIFSRQLAFLRHLNRHVTEPISPKKCATKNPYELLEYCQKVLGAYNNSGCVKTQAELQAGLLDLYPIFEQLMSYFKDALLMPQKVRASALKAAFRISILLLKQMDKHHTVMVCSRLGVDEESNITVIRNYCLRKVAELGRVGKIRSSSADKFIPTTKQGISPVFSYLKIYQQIDKGCRPEDVLALFQTVDYPEVFCKRIGDYIETIRSRNPVPLASVEHDEALFKRLKSLHEELRLLLDYSAYRRELFPELYLTRGAAKNSSKAAVIARATGNNSLLKGSPSPRVQSKRSVSLIGDMPILQTKSNKIHSSGVQASPRGVEGMRSKACL